MVSCSLVGGPDWRPSSAQINATYCWEHDLLSYYISELTKLVTLLHLPHYQPCPLDCDRRHIWLGGRKPWPGSFTFIFCWRLLHHNNQLSEVLGQNNVFGCVSLPIASGQTHWTSSLFQRQHNSTLWIESAASTSYIQSNLAVSPSKTVGQWSKGASLGLWGEEEFRYLSSLEVDA